MPDPNTHMNIAALVAACAPVAIAAVGWWQSRNKVSKDELTVYRAELRSDLDATRAEVRGLRENVEKLREKVTIVRAWLITMRASIDALRIHVEDTPTAVRLVDRMAEDLQRVSLELEETSEVQFNPPPQPVAENGEQKGGAQT